MYKKFSVKNFRCFEEKILTLTQCNTDIPACESNTGIPACGDKLYSHV